MTHLARPWWPALVMISTGWNGFDAVAGAVIALMMIPRHQVAAQRGQGAAGETPDDLTSIRYANIWKTCRMCAVHDLHASTVSTGMPILMAHVVVDKDLTMEDAATILTQLQDCLRDTSGLGPPPPSARARGL